MNRPVILLRGLLPILALLALSPADEKKPVDPPPETAPSMVDEAARQAVRSGLDWLARTQTKRGDWGESEWSLAISSMAGLALISSGHPDRGNHAEAVRRFTDFLLKSRTRQGVMRVFTDTRPALGHGFALLFLTQVYGMLDPDRNADIKTAIRDGVDYILSRQTGEGGWYEDYSPRATHYWIITVSQIQALRAARQCGFQVEKGAIERAIRFVQNSGFCTCSEPCLGMDAALIITLLAAGDHKNPVIDTRIAKLFSRTKFGYEGISYPIYTHFYTSQAMNFKGGEDWNSYYTNMRNHLTGLQVRGNSTGGYWNNPYPGHSSRPPARVYATAVACFILQMPNKVLPMLQYR